MLPVKHPAMNKRAIADHDNIFPRKKDDTLLKAAFEELFAHLLRFCFPGADKIFDLRKGFVFLDKELTELFPELRKQGGSRFVPKVRDAGKSIPEKR
jgi:hypothetical protein